MASPLFSSGVGLSKESKLFGVSSSKKFTISTWFKCDDLKGGIILRGGSTLADSNRIVLRIRVNTGDIYFALANAATTVIYSAYTTTAYDDNSWHHVVISGDLSNAVNWRVDRSAPTLTVETAISNQDIDFDGSVQWNVGNYLDADVSKFKGALFDLLFKAGEYVDLTDADKLKLFISSDGRDASGDLFYQNVGPNPGIKPVGYGVGAPVFNGEKADIIFSNSFQYNQGTGGAFVLTSTFDETEDPDVYRSAAHYGNKERWFESELTGFSYTRSKTFIEQREGHPKRGLRMGLDEMDDRFRQESPADTYQQLLFNDREEDTEEWDR